MTVAGATASTVLREGPEGANPLSPPLCGLEGSCLYEGATPADVRVIPSELQPGGDEYDDRLIEGQEQLTVCRGMGAQEEIHSLELGRSFSALVELSA